MRLSAADDAFVMETNVAQSANLGNNNPFVESEVQQ
jgi:hypothetical protein